MRIPDREVELEEILRKKLENITWFGLSLNFGYGDFNICLDGYYSIEELVLVIDTMREYFNAIKEEN